jgi:hypothetical protein
MRTTLTLDDDVAFQLRERARRTGASFKEVVNDAIRVGLQQGRLPTARPSRFRVTPRTGGFRPGIDLLHLNRLNDELEVERVVDDGRPSARE